MDQTAATPTEPPGAKPAQAATATPSPALIDTATPRPFPTLPPGNPLLIPTPTPGEAAAVDERSRPLIERAAQMLAGELGIAVEDVSLVLLEAVLWPDGGLGCATPDMIVQPVETPGYRIVLAVAGVQYEYHTDLDNQVVRCEIGRPGGGHIASREKIHHRDTEDTENLIFSVSSVSLW